MKRDRPEGSAPEPEEPDAKRGQHEDSDAGSDVDMLDFGFEEESSDSEDIDDLKFDDLSVYPVIPKTKLVEFIKGDSEDIPQHVKDWRKRYNENYKSATVELLLLIVEACCANIPSEKELKDNDQMKEDESIFPYVIKKELIGDTHPNVVKLALVQLAKIVVVEDYQISKNFRENLQSFWHHLVLMCQDGPLFNGVIFEKCMTFIIYLSSGPVKIYRQIAYLMGLQLLKTYIIVANSDDLRGVVGRGYDVHVEEYKLLQWPDVALLEKTYTVTHKISMLELMMCKMYHGLFVCCDRDEDEGIQISCIEACGKWMSSYPSMFLKDSQWNYIRYKLISESAAVRKTSIIAMRSIYKNTVGALADRITDRMIELGEDMSICVAICSIGLVEKLLRGQPHLVLDPLYDILIDDPVKIGPEIGELVYGCLNSQEFNSSQSVAKGVCNESSVRRMLGVLKKLNADRILIGYVINGVWEFMATMEDKSKEEDSSSCFASWECIISMLLEEDPGRKLDNDDARNLVLVLCATVQKAVGESIVPGTYIQKPSNRQKEKELFGKKRKNVTRAITAKRYVALISIFCEDDVKIASLIEIIIYLDLELFTEQEFETALKVIRMVFFEHSEKEVLTSCMKAFTHCLNVNQIDYANTVFTIFNDLKEKLIKDLSSSKVSGVCDSFLANLKRLYEVQLSAISLFDSTIVDALMPTSESITINEVVIFQLYNMQKYLTSWVRSGKESKSVTRKFISDNLVKLSNALEKCIDICIESHCVDHQYTLLCTMLDEFLDLTTSNMDKLSPPSASIIQKFLHLCEQQLSVSDVAGDEDAGKRYIDINADEVILAALPWVIGDTISIKIEQLMSHGRSVAEIVKHLISFLRKDGDFPNIVLEALKKVYHRQSVHPLTNDDERSNPFRKFEDLAAQLSWVCRGTCIKSDIRRIVIDSIDYAIRDAPQQSSFLEWTTPFALMLPTCDITEIQSKVQEQVAKLNKEGEPTDWDFYHRFLDHLSEEGIEDL